MGQAPKDADVPVPAHLLAPAHQAQLAERWVRGARIDWQALAPRQARRVSLPTYPFARTPYWYAQRPEPQPPAATATPAAEPVATGDVLADFRQAFAALEQVGQSLLLRAFQQLGCLRQVGETYSRAAFKQRIGLVPALDRLFEALLELCQQAGYIALDASGLRSTARVAESQEAGDAAYWARKYPDCAAHFQLLFHCMDRLADVLQGRVAATQVLFPEGSLRLVEPINKGNAVADYFNRQVVAEAVRQVSQALPQLAPGARYRILEVGAGTGGTSQALLEALAPFGERIHYHYTDLSLSFIKHGRKHYGHHPFVAFKVLDIEKDVARQGFEPHSYDLVVAANVLHATRRLATTLDQVKALLRPAGQVLINEAVAAHGFSTLTFGLLEGWWLSEDQALRLPHSPLLSVPLWQRLLLAHGFAEVEVLVPVAAEGVSQNVLLARCAGLPQPERAVTGNAALPAIDEDEWQQELVYQVERSLRKLVADVIEVEPEQVDPKSSFADMGVDSLLATEIIDQINQAFAIQLRATELFNYANTHDLAVFVRGRCGESPDQARLLRIFERLYAGELELDEADRLLAEEGVP